MHKQIKAERKKNKEVKLAIKLQHPICRIQLPRVKNTDVKQMT